MTQLFNRKVVAIVGDVRVEELRCAFQVKKTSTSKPNTAELKITNLSPATRAAIQDQALPLIIQAGYPGTIATIFSGTVRTVDHIWKSPDWETTIKSGDGERPFAFATVSECFRAGTPARVVLAKLIESLGLDPGSTQATLSQITAAFTHGYSAAGRASDMLDEILNGLGYEWSIQDGRVQVLKQGDTTREELIHISPESGLIDSPEHGSGDGKKPAPHSSMVKLKTLLQPRVKPGSRVSLESEGLTGILRVLTVEHVGDTAGGTGSWATTIQAIPVEV